MAGVTISGTEDADPAEYFDSQKTLESCWTLFLTIMETEEATKAKLKELDRLAEFGVYEIVDMHTALGKKRATTHWDLDHWQVRNQSTTRTKRVQER